MARSRDQTVNCRFTDNHTGNGSDLAPQDRVSPGESFELLIRLLARQMAREELDQRSGNDD